MRENKNRKQIAACPSCGADNYFSVLPKLGKAHRCAHCRRWLKVTSRLPVKLASLRPDQA